MTRKAETRQQRKAPWHAIAGIHDGQASRKGRQATNGVRYIASLPQPQRGIAEQIDQLAASTLPGLQRSVKWGMSYYGVGDGWCFCCGAFASHVKLMFVNGVTLDPVPPVTPVAMGKSTRGVELASVDDIDQARRGVDEKTRHAGVGKVQKKTRQPLLMLGGRPDGGATAAAEGDGIRTRVAWRVGDVSAIALFGLKPLRWIP